MSNDRYTLAYGAELLSLLQYPESNPNNERINNDKD